ncbi:MAG: hypothetical protein KKD63_06795 [Proteobacteria bacterium]|nr:hypothetical protein [Desulfobulbaceae bacterium]MBU4152570.1 hypothetical protein [Pseudomonadota bacterium]
MNGKTSELESAERIKSLKNITTVVYALQAASFLFGVTALVAIIINYVKKDDIAGTWLESHFRWQIRTFWFGLIWGSLGVLTLLVIIGYPILIADGVWIIYRIVKGWLYLIDGKPMYNPSSVRCYPK